MEETSTRSMRGTKATGRKFGRSSAPKSGAAELAGHSPCREANLIDRQVIATAAITSGSPFPSWQSRNPAGRPKGAARQSSRARDCSPYGAANFDAEIPGIKQRSTPSISGLKARRVATSTTTRPASSRARTSSSPHRTKSVRCTIMNANESVHACGRIVAPRFF